MFFIPRSLKTTRNNRSFPHYGPIKKFFTEILLFMHNEHWNSTKFKIEAKKILNLVYL